MIAAILTALVLPVWQKREEAIALSQQADQARQRAGVSDALRTELERRVGEYNFALERKYAFPGTVRRSTTSRTCCRTTRGSRSWSCAASAGKTGSAS